MPLGMLLRVQQFLEADGVELKLMSAENDEGADKLSELHHSLVVAEDAFIQFDGEPTAPAEIEARMRIMDGVIRYLCVKNEA